MFDYVELNRIIVCIDLISWSIGQSELIHVEHFLLKILPPQNIVPSLILFLFEYEYGFFVASVLFALFYSNLQIY